MQNGVTTKYAYRADGVKVRKSYGTNKTTDYLDGFQYENNLLQFVPTSEGYYDFVKNVYIYNIVDHLGNVRISYMRNPSGQIEILEENNYYPFGLKHEGYNNVMASNPAYQYKYNGKELQETGMYDYGARFYMPDIGRWGVVDPLAEKAPSWTPYRYAFDNPLKYTDPKGLFETRFGAWWHRMWHGGGSNIFQDKNNNQYYYTQKNGSSVDSNGGLVMNIRKEYGHNNNKFSSLNNSTTSTSNQIDILPENYVIKLNHNATTVNRDAGVYNCLVLK